MDDEVVIRTYDAPHEAELTASYLHQHGIAARIENNLVAGMNPLWSMALGGIRVRVPASDAERAQALLVELNNTPLESTPTAAESSGGPYRSVSSPDVVRFQGDPAARRALVAAVLGLFLLPVVLHAYSLWLVRSLPTQELSRRGQRHRMIAIVIDVAVLALAVAVLLARM